MPKFLFRVSTFAAASAAALGLFTLVRAAPTPSPVRTAGASAFTLAALNRPSVDEQLDDDAAAAGETGRATPGLPHRFQPPPRAAPDLAGPDGGPPEGTAPAPIEHRPQSTPYAEGNELPYDAGPVRELSVERRRRHRETHREPHRSLGHRPVREAMAPPHRPAPAAAPAAPFQSQAPLVHPHRVHIVVEPLPKLALAQPEDTAAVAPDLPSVQADPAARDDAQQQLAELTRVVVTDMRSARLKLDPELLGGRQGAVTLTLPAQLLVDLDARSQELGLGAMTGATLTATLSGQGYELGSAGAQTTTIVPGEPAILVWQAAPTGDAGGSLTAELTASVAVDGEPVTLPLGALTVRPPVAVAAAPSVPSAAPTPQPDLRTWLLGQLDLRRFGLPRLNLHDLAIPGHPIVDVPLVGEAPSENVVAAGLALLALMLLRSLFAGPRRRRTHDFEMARYGDERF